jgi:hypothetical protein
MDQRSVLVAGRVFFLNGKVYRPHTKLPADWPSGNGISGAGISLGKKFSSSLALLLAGVASLTTSPVTAGAGSAIAAPSDSTGAPLPEAAMLAFEADSKSSNYTHNTSNKLHTTGGIEITYHGSNLGPGIASHVHFPVCKYRHPNT